MKKTKPPVVVLLGRTNSGKSTLFNRLTEHGKAIISPLTNTTRDQNRDFVYWKGSMCELIDTGGLDMAALDPLDLEIQRQVQRAIAEADAVIVVVDGKHDMMPQDRDVLSLLRKANKPAVLCVNKVDSQRIATTAESEFAPLNIEPMHLISALTGSGTNDLLDSLFELLPHYAAPEFDPEIDSIHLALVGRPNVGKSSLFNAMVGEDMVIVSDIAHTTRDVNDSELHYKDRVLHIIDTAGIRRKNRVGQWSGSRESSMQSKVERIGVHAALQSVERCDVVILVVEAQKYVSKQDKVLVHFAQQHGKSLVIAVNKWDTIPDKDSNTINEYVSYFSHHLGFAQDTPVIFTSAIDHLRVTELLDLAITTYDKRFAKADPAHLSDVLYSVMRTKPLQRKLNRNDLNLQRKPLKLISLDQIGVNPPVFRLVTSSPKAVAPALMHTIEKGIREDARFAGVPIQIDIRNS